MNRFLSISLMSFLLLAPSVALGSAIFADVAADVAENAVKALTEAAAEAGEEAVSEAVLETANAAVSDVVAQLASMASDIMAEAAEEGMSEAAIEALQSSLEDTITSMVNDSVAGITESFATLTEDTVADALTAVSGDLTSDFASQSADNFAKAINEAVEKGTVTATEAAELVGEEALSESAAKALEETAAETAEDTATKATQTAAEKFGSFMKNLGIESAKMLGMGLIMMVPQSFMTAIAAENARNALLATLAQPIKIGKYVLQIPAQFIDTDSPSDSIYLYVVVPLSSTTQEIDSDMQTMWPGLYGPGSDNTISQSFSVVGSSDTDAVLRYTIDPEYLQTANFACTAPAASYSTTLGDTYINSASSPGVNLVLNNGSKFVADGTDGGNDPMQLVGESSDNFTALSAITYFLNKIDNEATSYDFTEYIQINATLEADTVDTVSSDGTTSDVVTRLLNCACLEGGDYSDLDNTCTATEGGSILATCMLANALATLQSGTVIDGTGAEVTNSAILTGHALSDDELAGSSQTGTATEYNVEDDLGYQIANGLLTAAFTGASNALKNAGSTTAKASSGSGSGSGSSGGSSSTSSAASDAVASALASTLTGTSSSTVSAAGLSLSQLSQKHEKSLVVGQDLTDDSSTNTDTLALGGVIPVFGWDTGFTDMLSAFTAASTITNDTSGALVVELASADGSAVATNVSGAPVNNYAAKGVEVYLSGNTPFTRDLREAMGLSSLDSISEMSPTGAVVDMIVFLDIDQNQVPLLTVEPTAVYGSEENNNVAYLPKYVLNPAIHYWVSLVSADLPEFYEDKYGASPMYDMQGNAWGSGYTADTIQAFFDAVGAISPALEQQLLDHKKAMVDQYLDGPFGKDDLTTNSDLQFTGGGVNYVFYEGLNPVGVPMGNQITMTDAAGNESVITDYLMPFNASGSTAVSCILPDSNVTYFMGLMTDILYTYENGYLTPYSYALAPINVNSDGGYTTNTATNSVLGIPNSLDNYTLYTMVSGSLDDTTAFDALMVDVKSARSEWVSQLSALNSSTISTGEINGFAVSDSLSIRLFSTESSANGCPIWLLNNSPLEYGLFVATNSVNSSSVTITPVTADQFTTATAFVDLVSGLVVAQDAGYQYGVDGFNISVNADDILAGLKTSYPSAFSDTFNAIRANYQTKYNAAADEMVYPIAFGDKSIGIYRGDLDREDYVYWTYSGTAITDYFVAVNSSETLDNGDPDLTSAIFVGPLCSETQFLLSLADGQLYSLEGKSAVFSSYTAIVDQLGPSWRSEIQTGIASKNAEFLALSTALEAEATRIAAATASYSSTTLTESDSDRAAIATRLASASYLSYPHGSLKQDSTTGKYYNVVPQDGTSTDTSYYYLDFDAPNSGVTTDGDAVEMAAMFDSDGEIVGADSGFPFTFNKLQTYSYRKQYGVGVASDGTQVLGAVGGQPALFLSSTDSAVTPGESGETMVNASDPNFPSVNIDASVVSDDKTFYYYYSLIMQNYYALVVDSSTGESYWMSMDGGHKYNLDGTSKTVNNPLAFGATLAAVAASADDTSSTESATQTVSPATTNNLLFAYENSSGYMNCWMPNQSNGNVYSEFSNSSSSFDGTQSASDGTGYCMNTMNALSSPYNSVNVAQTPRPDIVPPVPPVTYATDYYVGWDETAADHYSVDSSYVWNALRLMDDETSAYQDLCLASKSGVVTHALFAGNLYSTSSTASPYSMTAVLDSSASAITITVASDDNTGNMKATVVGGGSTTPYNYQYSFDTLSDDQLSQYQLSLWAMTVTPNANGITVLAPNMTTGSDGSVSISLVSYSDIDSDTLPVDEDGSVSLADQSSLQTAVSSIVYDPVQSVYYYNSTSDSTYVRIKDGVTFSSAGIATTTYSPSELTDLVNDLQMTVVEKEDDGRIVESLIYRAPTN